MRNEAHVRRLDPWKLSAGALALALAAVVARQWVPAAEAQLKTINRPQRVGAPAAAGDKGDGKKAPPAVRAAKILESARTTLLKAKPDAEGRRDKALKLVNVALGEAKALGEDEEVAQ